MNQKELTKTFMTISNWTKRFGLDGFYKNISALKGLIIYIMLSEEAPSDWSIYINPFKPEFTVVIFIHYKP